MRILLLLSTLCLGTAWAQQTAIRQRAIELKNSLVVLTIALQPGDEDFGLIESLRKEKGASIISAYLTNGEAGESDAGSVYPYELASVRRDEATRAMESLGATAWFMNAPAPGSVIDTAGLRQVWDRDSIQLHLMRVVSSVRPNLVILLPERLVGAPSVAWKELKELLREALRRLQQPRNLREVKRLGGLAVWEVRRGVVGKRLQTGNTVTGHVAERHYTSLLRQFDIHRKTVSTYREAIYPPGSLVPKKLGDGIRQKVSATLRNLNSRIDRLTNEILSQKKLTDRSIGGYLKTLTPIADSVDYLVGMRYSSFRGPDQKTLLMWKEGLQNLKNELLGVSVRYTLEDSILTGLQVTTLTIDSIRGPGAQGHTWLFFPPAKDRWIINETMEQRHAVSSGTEFRIVTPAEVPYNLPAQFDGLDKQSIYTPIDFFVVHNNPERAKSFGKRITIPFRFAPRFTVEVLTPLIKAGDGEEVVVRLTNHSRDGVADNIGISDTLAISSRALFRLNEKSSPEIVKLNLQWKSPVVKGSFVLPIDIGGVTVAHVAARAFDVHTDTLKTVGLISHSGPSAAWETLRRMQLTAERRTPAEVTPDWLSRLDVVVADHRLWTLEPEIANVLDQLRSHAEGGGRVLVLSQDAATWNASPLIRGLVLEESNLLGPDAAVEGLNGHPLMVSPNTLEETDWESWLFSRAANTVTAPAKVEVPVRIGRGNVPAIVTENLGKGKVTFVNLNLPAQWLNIHAGSFRLFANLLAY